MTPGLDYMYARYYGPQNLFRFLSVDPDGANPANLQSWNKYAYTLNNPIKYLDESGRYAQFFLGWRQKEKHRKREGNNRPGLLTVTDNLQSAGVNLGITNGPSTIAPGSLGRRARKGAAVAEESQEATKELIGFSRGAIAAVRAAEKQSGSVDLLVTVDPMLRKNHTVSDNVKLAINISNDNGRLTAADPSKTAVINLSVPDGVGHSAIDNNANVQNFVEAATKLAEQGKLTEKKARKLAGSHGLRVKK